jgi:hypothetical protein
MTQQGWGMFLLACVRQERHKEGHTPLVVNVKMFFTWVSVKVDALAYSSCLWKGSDLIASLKSSMKMLIKIKHKALYKSS